MYGLFPTGRIQVMPVEKHRRRFPLALVAKNVSVQAWNGRNG